MYSGFIKLAKESGATITSVWGKYDDTHLGWHGSGVLTRNIMFWATFSGIILCATTMILMSVAAAMENSGNSVIKALRANNESAVRAATPFVGIILLILLLALHSLVQKNRQFNQKLPSRLLPRPKWNPDDDIGPFSTSLNLINDGVLPAINTALENAGILKLTMIQMPKTSEYINYVIAYISCIKFNIEKVTQLLTNLNTIFAPSEGECSLTPKELLDLNIAAYDIHTHIQALYLQSTLVNRQCHDILHGYISPSKPRRVAHLKHTKSCAFNFGHDFNKLVSYLNDLKEREDINEDITTKIRNTNLRCITPDSRLPSYSEATNNEQPPSYSEATNNEQPPSRTLTSASVAPLQEYELTLGSSM